MNMTSGANAGGGRTHSCMWTVLTMCAVLLLCAARPAAAGIQPCGPALFPQCSGGGFCDPGSVCIAQGSTCVCSPMNCGDFAACDGFPCPPGSLCTNLVTRCGCVAVATPTATVTPIPTQGPASAPAASTGGLVIALLALAAIGTLGLARRSGL
jgi:hypothetical protein